jgi:acetoin utilization protein AcuB
MEQVVEPSSFNSYLVDEYTTPVPICVAPDASLNELKTIMSDEGIRHIPVIENDLPIGIISDRDIHFLTEHVTDRSLLAREVMTPGPLTIKSDSPLDEAAYQLSNYKIGCALVVDDGGKLTGIFTTTDALNALIEISRGES